MNNKQTKRKKSNKRGRTGYLWLAAGLLFALGLGMSGCKGQVSAPTSETGSNSAVEESSAVSEGEEKESKDNFLTNIIGNYTCTVSTGDTYAISFYNAYGNLYAQCGIAVPVSGNEKRNLTVMPYSGVEIIPVKAGDFSEKEKNEFEAGFMPFSQGTNQVSGYYGAPVKGSIALDGDKVSINLNEGTICSQWEEQKSLVFEKNELVTDSVTMTKAEMDEVPKNHVPEELYGIWAEENREGIFCIDIRKGADGEADRVQIYEKAPGEQAFVGRGLIGSKTDGSVYTKYRGILADYAQDWEFDYSMEGDVAVFHTRLGYMDSYTGEEARISISFRKIEKSDIPLAALYEPDDITALKGNLSVSLDGSGNRPVVPQFLATDDVENNGGYFVRIGKLIFFRYYADIIKPEMLCYNYNFLKDADQQDNGMVCWYDPESKESGVAFYDASTGPIYYVNGKICSDEFLANDVESFRRIYSYWPDGSGKVCIAGDGYNYIESVWDNKYLVYTDFYEGLMVLYDGFLDYKEYDFDSFEYPTDIREFEGKLFVSALNSNQGQYSFYVMNDEHTLQYLSSFYHDKWSKIGNPIVEQVLSEEGYIYVGLGCYEQTGEFKNYLVIRFPEDGGEAEIAAEEAPQKGSFEEHHFIINAMGEIVIRSTAGDEVVLSKDTYGDLEWLDSPFSAVRVAADYIKDDPEKVKNGEQTVLLQTAEKVGDLVYIIRADATYDESATSDRHRAFSFEGYTYSIIPVSYAEDAAENYEEIPITVALPEEIVSKAGTNTGNTVWSSEHEAYERLLDIYKSAAEKGLTYEEASVDNLGRSLWDTGWAQGLGGAGYVYYDINKDGTDELIILYDNEIKTIYGFDGEDAVMAMDVSYRETATLYDDGKLFSVFGTMNYATEHWAEFNAVLGRFFAVAEKSYEPTSGDPKNVQYFVMCAGEDTWEEIEESYKQWKTIPVWAFEIFGEITEEEYNGYASKGKEVTFSDIIPLE